MTQSHIYMSLEELAVVCGIDQATLIGAIQENGSFIHTIELKPDQALGLVTAPKMFQRKVAPADVEKYKRAMVEGKWENNGDPIRFGVYADPSSRPEDWVVSMMDGQHRMEAQVNAGVSLPVSIFIRSFYDLEDMKTAVLHIDAGKRRTNRDRAGMSGVDRMLGVSTKAATKYTGAVENILREYMDPFFRVDRVDQKRPEVQENARRRYAHNARLYLATIRTGDRFKKGNLNFEGSARREEAEFLNQAFFSTGIITMSIGPKAEEFWYKVVTSGASVGHPAHSLREYFKTGEHVSSKFTHNIDGKRGPLYSDERGPGASKQKRLLIACMIAWNHFMQNPNKKLTLEQLAKATAHEWKWGSGDIELFGSNVVDPGAQASNVKTDIQLHERLLQPGKNRKTGSNRQTNIAYLKWALSNPEVVGGPETTTGEIAVIFGLDPDRVREIQNGKMYGNINPVEMPDALVSAKRDILETLREQY